ncbi:MAG: GHKL domain-containing protein [Melioribacter sp.]|nr:GHKL domain-containing protein [Melioribacter sp.]
MINRLKLFFTSSRFKIALWYAAVFLVLETILGVVIYFYILQKSEAALDSNIESQAKAILRGIEEKHFDLETFQPDSIYKSKDELIWDIIYDAIVFNRRNTFIQISSLAGVVFKSANLVGNEIKAEQSNQNKIIKYYNPKLSEHPIRLCILRGRGYSVIVAYPTDQIEQMLGLLNELYLIIAPLFFIISIAGGFVISYKSLSRIDKIILKTSEITAHNLKEIIPGGNYKDEFGRLVNTMNEMIGRIKKSVEYMNEFSLAAAHELKTPLTILRGEIEIALKSEKSKERYIEVLQSNYEETLRMIRIIDNLFFISKSEKDLIKLERCPVELSTFLKSVVDNMKMVARERGMYISLNLSKDIIINIDTGLIKQALYNIIDNAIKYGIEKSTIEITSKEISEKINISITNSGCGIEPDKVEKIFDKFYRADESRTKKSGGVGLGLSVVKSIIELHGGSVFVNSKPNETTTFSISLPKEELV